jgi:hypothetical protein
MKKLKPQLVAGVAAGSITSGAIAAGLILGLGSKRNIELYSCSTDKNIEYIVKSGPEYLIVNPSYEWGRNSFLASKETRSIPKNWLYLGIPIKTVGSNGFELYATETKPYIKSVEFNSESLKLIVNFGAKGVKPWVTTCKTSGSLAKVQSAANNVPVEYLLGRQNNLPFLNPSIGQKKFNLDLYNVLKSKKNSTYSVYQLLAGLPVNALTGNESLVMKAAREDLIKENSNEFPLWEFNGTYRYNWQFANESDEANIHAGNWCRGQQNGNVAEYTSKGFKVVSSTPEVRSSGGWVRHDYPDGRFSGFVNYKAECDGTNNLLRKEGFVDRKNENTISPYD